MKHTWRAEKFGSHWIVVDLQSGRIVADRIPSEAEAMVIAASPELKDVCGKTFNYLTSLGRSDSETVLGKILDVLDYARKGASVITT